MSQGRAPRGRADGAGGTRRGDAVAFGVSLAAHAALIGYVLWATSTPELDFELQLPDQVEFGLTDAVEVSTAAPATAPQPPDPAAADPAGEGPGGVDAGVPRDAGLADAGPGRDAGPRDGGRPDAAAPEAVAAAQDGAGEPGEGSGDARGDGQGVAFLPAGSQIALRIDVARIARSPLAGDVRELLGVLPDWQALLDGSGIEPLDDLDRILIASPNLQRSRLIVAGRAAAGQAEIRAAAERLAAASGEPLRWARRGGVPTAPWRDGDPTERIIALIGPRHFVISRPQDLPRVLAVAADRAAEGDEAEHPADALLSMREGEGLSLEIEGARNFARASPRRGRNPLAMVPTELRLALSERPGDEIAARTRWTYDGAEQAEEAGAYWNRMREGFSRNIIANVLGVAGILRRATLEPEGDTIEGRVDLRTAEMRQLLNLGRQMFLDRARAQQRAAGRGPAAPGEPDGAGEAEGAGEARAGTPPAEPPPPVVPPSPY